MCSYSTLLTAARVDFFSDLIRTSHFCGAIQMIHPLAIAQLHAQHLDNLVNLACVPAIIGGPLR